MASIHRDEAAELQAAVPSSGAQAMLVDSNAAFSSSCTSSSSGPIDSKDINARRRAPLLCFHSRCQTRDRAANPGVKLNAATKEYWKNATDEWKLLPEDHPDKQLAYLDSDASDADALRRRTKAKAGREEAQLAMTTTTVTSSSSSAVELHASPLASAHALNLLLEAKAGIRDRLEVLDTSQTEQVCSSLWPMGLEW